MTKQGLRAMLRELAQHPAGVHSSNPALAEWDTAQVGTQARKLVKLGQLFSAKIAHRNARYFSSAAARDTFVRKYATEKPYRVTAARYEVADRAPWPADAPAHRPEGLVVIQCPGFVPRFQQHVFSFIHGGLRCA